MIKLKDIEDCIRPNFILARNNTKILATTEEHENSKEIARIVFVGISEIYGHKMADVCEYLEIDYNEYRQKLQLFRAYHTLQTGATRRDKRFHYKIRLCLNAAKYKDDKPMLQLDYKI